MDEAQWSSSRNPTELLMYIEDHPEVATPRHLRLFRAACNRLLLPYLTESCLIACVDASERYAEGALTNDEFRQVVFATPPHDRGSSSVWALSHKLVASHYFDEDVPYECRMMYIGDIEQFQTVLEAQQPRRCSVIRDQAFENMYPQYFSQDAKRDGRAGYLPAGAPLDVVAYMTRQRAQEDECRQERLEIKENQRIRLCNMLRDIVPNPFREPNFQEEWVTPTVYALAQEIHVTSDYHRMYDLGDMIQEAGCHSYDPVSHCYTDHVRGCWYLEMVLCIGREKGFGK